MHDVVCDVAKLIASGDSNMLVVKADGGPNEWLDANALKRCRAFSVFGVDVHELSNEIECPELRFLPLRGGDRPLQISNSFCEGMGMLMVLDLI